MAADCQDQVALQCHILNGGMKVPIRIVIVLFSLLTGFGIIWSCKSMCSGVCIVVVNEGDHPLCNVEIHFSGGSLRIPKLQPRAKYKAKINPKGESHLTVDFADASGGQHVQPIDVYFESGYQGKVEIKIDGSSNVTWQSVITP